MLPPETDFGSKGKFMYDTSGFVPETAGLSEKDHENILDQHNPQSNVPWNTAVPAPQPFLQPSLYQESEYAGNGYFCQQTNVSQCILLSFPIVVQIFCAF